MKRTIDNTFWSLMAIVFAVTIANSAIALDSIARLYRSGAQVSHSQAVLAALTELMSAAKDAETGQRGFVITGDSAYLAPYLVAQTTIGSWLRDVDTLTRANPGEQAGMPELRRLVSGKLQELRETVALRQNEGPAAAERLVRSGVGKSAMDSLRATVNRMVGEENRVLAERTVTATRSRAAADATLLLAAAIEMF